MKKPQSFLISVLVAAVSSVLVASCATPPPPKKQAVKAPPVADQDMKLAEKAMKAGDNKKAMTRLRQMATQYPESEVAGRSHFLMGQIHLNAQRYQEALNEFTAILKSGVASPYETDARIRAAFVSLKLSQAC